MRDTTSHKASTTKGIITHPSSRAFRSFAVRYMWIHVLVGEKRIAAEIIGVLMGFHRDWKKQPPCSKDNKHCWLAISVRTLAKFTGSSETRVKEAVRFLQDLMLIHVHHPTSATGRSMRRHIALNVEKLNAAASWINTNGMLCVCVPGPDNDSVFVPCEDQALLDSLDMVEL